MPVTVHVVWISLVGRIDAFHVSLGIQVSTAATFPFSLARMNFLETQFSRAQDYT